MEVTVGDVTVIITDYKLLPVKDEKTPPESPGQLEPTATTITTTTKGQSDLKGRPQKATIFLAIQSISFPKSISDGGNIFRFVVKVCPELRPPSGIRRTIGSRGKVKLSREYIFV